MLKRLFMHTRQLKPLGDLFALLPWSFYKGP